MFTLHLAKNRTCVELVKISFTCDLMKFAQFPQLSECGNKYSIDTDLLMMIYINTE